MYYGLEHAAVTSESPRGPLLLLSSLICFAQLRSGLIWPTLVCSPHGAPHALSALCFLSRDSLPCGGGGSGYMPCKSQSPRGPASLFISTLDTTMFYHPCSMRSMLDSALFSPSYSAFEILPAMLHSPYITSTVRRHSTAKYRPAQQYSRGRWSTEQYRAVQSGAARYLTSTCR